MDSFCEITLFPENKDRMIGADFPLFRGGIIPSPTKSSCRVFNDDPTTKGELDVGSMFGYK